MQAAGIIASAGLLEGCCKSGGAAGTDQSLVGALQQLLQDACAESLVQGKGTYVVQQATAFAFAQSYKVRPSHLSLLLGDGTHFSQVLPAKAGELTVIIGSRQFQSSIPCKHPMLI